MSSIRFIVRAAVAAVGGAWCASALAQTPVPFDAGKVPALQRIDVLDVSEPAALLVYGRVPPAAARKAADGVAPRQQVAHAGAAIAATADVSTKLKNGMARRNMTLASELARQLVAALKKQGYDARLLAGQRLGMKANGGLDASAVKTDAKAVLQVKIRSAGYLPHQGGDDLLPTVSAEAALVAVPGQTVLYRQLLSAGASLGPVGSAHYVPLPRERKYGSRAAVAADVDNAADGLRDATDALAGRIAEQLAR